ncbi:carbohydrate ABC transporter permease [Cypionkella sp. TWP1-2-1b2]|uniref:carbohydrate ABC transporter permease n=1 Tax=Cypionkella sp. TWP1-2-1b2 TaxID=2804675 RepID=UPI003CF31BD6
MAATFNIPNSERKFAGLIPPCMLQVVYSFYTPIRESFEAPRDLFSCEKWKSSIPKTSASAEAALASTGRGFYRASVVSAFWKVCINTAIVTVCATIISLTFNRVSGYELARMTFLCLFYGVLGALVVWVMPNIMLQSVYVLPFCQPRIWEYLLTAITVLMVLNRQIIVWTMFLFVPGMPCVLVESAIVNGWSRFQSFRTVVMQVTWLGVVIMCVSSFLLAYNDLTAAGLMMGQENQTIVPKIASIFGKIENEGKTMYAAAEEVRSPVRISFLVRFFERPLVGGITAGAITG